jgi:hypothetical protein
MVVGPTVKMGNLTRECTFQKCPPPLMDTPWELVRTWTGVPSCRGAIVGIKKCLPSLPWILTFDSTLASGVSSILHQAMLVLPAMVHLIILR